MQTSNQVNSDGKTNIMSVSARVILRVLLGCMFLWYSGNMYHIEMSTNFYT